MRKEKLLQLASLIVIELIILMPVYVAAQVNGTNQTAPVPTGTDTITATAPDWVNANRVDVSGTTSIPNAKLEYYIGQAKVKIGRALPDGTFTTTGVPLTKKGENTVTVKAVSESRQAEATITVNVDTTPPVMNLSEIPAITTARQINVRGNVSEDVRLSYASYVIKDDIAPAQVTGLAAGQIQKNSVTLTWDPATELDFLEYAVYRDGARIAVTRSTTMTDNAVASDKRYSYRVSAVDDSCNEGIKSDAVSAKTQDGGSANETAAQAEFSCKPAYAHLDVVAPFNLTFDLSPDGRTIIEINAKDRAGNVDEFKKEVKFDAGPPQFLTANLDTIGTTYIPDITLKGNLSEQATVFVYMNGKATEYFEVTDEQGYFEIPITLKAEVEVNTSTAAVNTGIGWENKIALKAVDLAGQESWYPAQQQTKTIVWAQCGFGSWMDFDADKSSMSPTKVTPRLVQQGLQQLGIPFRIKYTGGQQGVELGQINVVPVRVSPDLEDWFDNDKISQPVVFSPTRNPQDPNEWFGYIQINFAQFPLDLLELEDNATQSDIEMAISEWRRGEVIPQAGTHERGAYFIPGCPGVLGCMRFYFEVDIPLREKRLTRDPLGREQTIWEQRRQRDCLVVTIDIDQTIPPDIYPTAMLESSSEFLQKVIDVIDKLIQPLTDTTRVLIYSCMGAMAVLFLSSAVKSLACTGLSGASETIAEANLCELYDTENGQDAFRACKRCRDVIEFTTGFKENFYTPICDRIGCPNAPTLQKYIGDSRRKVKSLAAEIQKAKMPGKELINDTTVKNATEKYGFNEDLWSGNSCAFSDLNTNKDLQIISRGYDVNSTDSKSGIQKVGIKQLYKLYTDTPEKYEFCEDILHPAHPYCCGHDYMDEWNSACGVGNLGGSGLGGNIDTFSEIRESMGLSAQRAGRALEVGEYSNIFNFLSGLCSSKGDAKPEIIRTELSFNPVRGYAEQNLLFMFVEPTGLEEDETYGEKFLYKVYAGYIAKSYELSALNASQRNESGLRSGDSNLHVFATNNMDIVELADFTEYFSAVGTGNETAARKQFVDNKQFCNKLSIAGVGLIPDCSSAIAGTIYDKVKGYVGTTEQEYIVKPASGLWTSVRCHCLPAIVQYLEHWRSITLEIKYCFDTILTTGDYDTGVCRAVLAKYVCDLLWEIITCFVNVWNKPGGLRAETGPVGDFFGALTGAGTSIAGEVEGRYGSTSTFNAIFNEQELVHGLCFMAFGMEYNININALTQTTIDSVATEPPPILFEICERRFLGFNPSTSPKGLTTWEYHFGIMAIAAQEANVKLELICSEGFDCDSSEGFALGECDCNRGGKKQTSIRPTAQACPGWQDRLSSGQMLNVDCYHMLQTQQHRYDKAKLTIEWQDPQTGQTDKVEKEIDCHEIGGNPPAFCAFDPFTLSFRCKFGEDPSGIRIERAEPKYQHYFNVTSTNIVPVFAIGDYPTFNFDFRQRLPEDPAEADKGIKFLTYTIKNSAGENVTVMHPSQGTLSQDYELKTDGYYTREIKIDKPIDASMFTTKTSKGTPFYTNAWSNVSGVPASLLKDNIPEANIDVKYYKNGILQPIPTNYYGAGVMVIDIQNNKVNAYLHVGANGTTGWFIMSGQRATQHDLTLTAGQTYYFNYTNPTTNDTIMLEFRVLKTDLITQQSHVQYVVIPRAGASASELPCNAKQPMTWTAEFKIYNADQYGQPTDQVAVDPTTGMLAEKTIAFQTICMNASELMQQPPAGALGPALGAASPTPAQTATSGQPPAATPTPGPGTKINAAQVSVDTFKVFLTPNQTAYLTIEPGAASITVNTTGTATKVNLTGSLAGQFTQISSNAYKYDFSAIENTTHNITINVYTADQKTDTQNYAFNVRTSLAEIAIPLLELPLTSLSTPVIDGKTLSNSMLNPTRIELGHYNLTTATSIPQLVRDAWQIPAAEGTNLTIKVYPVVGTSALSWTSSRMDVKKPDNKWHFVKDMNLGTGYAGNWTIKLEFITPSAIEKESYYVNLVQSTPPMTCLNKGGVCSSDCSAIPKADNYFVGTSNRQCCISPFLTGSADGWRLTPAECIADYGGRCSGTCQQDEQPIPYGPLLCNQAGLQCCVPESAACPGASAPNCAETYENVGALDCPTAYNNPSLTCCIEFNQPTPPIEVPGKAPLFTISGGLVT